MTNNTDLFSGDNQTPKDTSSSTADGAEILKALVGDDKPFKTVEDLAKSKREADTFIETLKRENKEMRDSLGKAATSDETNKLLKDIMAKLVPASDVDSDEGNQPPGKSLTQEDIVNMVQGTIKQNEDARTKVSNRTQANFAVLQHFGGDEGKAKAAIANKAGELGLSREQLAAMAETTPQVFLTVMGVSPRTAPATRGGLPLDKSRNPEAPLGPDGVVRNFNYYKKLRKDVGDSKFYQPRIQQQMIKDRKTMGEEFFDKPQT